MFEIMVNTGETGDIYTLHNYAINWHFLMKTLQVGKTAITELSKSQLWYSDPVCN